MEENRYDRQILAFGEGGQERIAAMRVGIVGLGGLGSHIAQGLAYLGVKEYVVVDDDRVEVTNLNRLVGAFPKDVDTGMFKVDVAERMIKMIKPDSIVTSVMQNLRSQDAIDALVTCPIIFGCVDHDTPRLILMELSAAYEITLIDSATEIILENGCLQEFGGRIVVSRPGDFCLNCAGQIDMEVAKEELETPEIRELRKKHGYGLGEKVKAPAIISLNGVVANIAITEFVCMITGIREPNRQLIYHGERGIVNSRKDKRRDNCYSCGYLKGKTAAANIKRYIV